MGVFAGALQAVICVLALCISSYAYYIENAKESDEDFEAMCDIGPWTSCSAVLTSKYSRGLGMVGPLLGDSHPLNVSNALLGLLFYSTIFLLGCIPALLWLQMLLLGASLVANGYLSYLMFVLGDFCLVCSSLYLATLALFLLALYRFRTRSSDVEMSMTSVDRGKHKRS